MRTDLRKTKIVGTIGPASEHRLPELFEAGLNVCRINYSHGSWDEQSEKTEEVIRLRKELDLPIAMILDMQGPEIRTGMLVTGKNEKIPLEDGQKFVLVNEDIIGDKERVSVSYKGLYNDVKPGAKILIDDGAIELVVDEIVDKDIHCTVVHGNPLGSRKTMNLPGTPVRLPALKEKDINDLITACEHDYDYVAMSFTRGKDDIDQVRKVLDEHGGKDIKIITKVENVEGLDHMEEIVENADAQMIARGDMATETDFTEPPIMQKKFIKLSNRANKPAITATQMLESMTHNPLPTRAEANDVANAIYDRTSAIMLSGECAMGEYPVECVKTMDKIAKRIEPTINYWKRFDQNENIDIKDLEDNIAYTVCVMAKSVKADAIVCYTSTGKSARRLSGMGAGCPIFAITDNRRTFNQLALAWNVFPVLIEGEEDINLVIEKGIEKHKVKGNLVSGDKVILAGGSKILPAYATSKIFGGYLTID
ncbi:MAG: pyruvate kinase [Clostridia bacterium]|jgi:pyruvate kinase|nr:pyruvate kinase [Clostridia bacterium]